MQCVRRVAGCTLLLASLLSVSSCANVTALGGALSYAAAAGNVLGAYPLSGDTLPVLDPSIIRQGATYYAFSTDVAGFASGSAARGSLPIRCSEDKVSWAACGSVFPQGMPEWIAEKIPGVQGLWAPDISYFNGEYHLYYNGSLLNTNRTVIGLAINKTLDPADPRYRWVDRGMLLESNVGDDFNALDPNILVDVDGRVWLTYGSYWSGIQQREIDPATGMLLAGNPERYNLATRPGVPNNPIEGASLVRHGSYYYLFVSVDYCCEATVAEDDYKQAVGRSTSPHGPFVDERSTPMMHDGGTVLIEGNANWNAPGGGTAFLDAATGESLLIFHAQNLHAQNLQQGGTPYAWIKKLGWVNDWPVLNE
jgi:arabinan endo-1,5-alpha-L-arabinosidase